MHYLLKLSIALAVVYLVYWLLLRRLTFYNWNRWYLLGYSLCCFIIPLINVFELLQQHGLQDAAVVSYIPAITVADEAAAEQQRGINWWMVYGAVIAAGSVLMLGRLLVQFLSLKRLQSSAVLLSDGNVKLYHVNKNIIPFSTGSAIYVNRHLHNEQELQEIIRHEFIHVKQRHSVDLWWSEILCIVNWYNPFAWLIRKAIRQNLEFIADHQVLQSGLDRKQYQYLLLKVTGNATYSIASNFNFSSLKKRIVMMNKNKSANIHLVRFLFILPLLVVVLLAFRSVAVSNLHYAEKKLTDTIPPAPPKVVDIKVKKPSPPTPPPAPAAAPKPGRVTAPSVSPAPVAAPDVSPAPVPAEPAVLPAAPNPPAKVKVRGTGAITDGVTTAPAATTAYVQSEHADAVTVNVTDAPAAQSRHANIATVSAVGNRSMTTTADVIEIQPDGVRGTASRVIFNNGADVTEILVINSTTTRQELEQAIHALKEKGFTLELNNVQYEGDELVSLKGTISNDKVKATFSGDHFKVITVCVQKNDHGRLFTVVRGGSVPVQD